MSRIIEIVLVLTPLLGFFTWRLLFPSPLPPTWLVGWLAAFVVLMFVALFWLRQIDAEDANKAYVPAEIHDGQIVPAHPAGGS
jgi:hypothetical protein